MDGTSAVGTEGTGANRAVPGSTAGSEAAVVVVVAESLQV